MNPKKIWRDIAIAQSRRIQSDRRWIQRNTLWTVDESKKNPQRHSCRAKSMNPKRESMNQRSQSISRWIQRDWKVDESTENPQRQSRGRAKSISRWFPWQSLRPSMNQQRQSMSRWIQRNRKVDAFKKNPQRQRRRAKSMTTRRPADKRGPRAPTKSTKTCQFSFLSCNKKTRQVLLMYISTVCPHPFLSSLIFLRNSFEVCSFFARLCSKLSDNTRNTTNQQCDRYVNCHCARNFILIAK